jgi:hypothetical protein
MTAAIWQSPGVVNTLIERGMQAPSTFLGCRHRFGTRENAACGNENPALNCRQTLIHVPELGDVSQQRLRHDPATKKTPVPEGTEALKHTPTRQSQGEGRKFPGSFFQ